jgi:hypothetical protein
MKTHGGLRNMGNRRAALVLLLAVGTGAVSGGCSRQDTESLAGIGRKLADRAAVATASCRARFDGLNTGAAGNSIQDKVTRRLRWEKVLADIPIEVTATGDEIELKGTVKNAEQRTRATELAEATVGVTRVLVSLTVTEEKKDE